MTTSPALPRFDPLLLIHKAVRHVLFEVAAQVGTVDASDIFALDRCAKQVGRLVDLLPDAAEALVPLCDALYQRDAATRHAAAASLYREVMAVIAAQLARQQALEATSTPGLQAAHTDEDLRAMRRMQLAAMSERELADAMAPIGAAATPQELAAFLDDLQASVDPQTFGCLVDSLRRGLDAPRWDRVVRERGDCPTSESRVSCRPEAALHAAGACAAPLQRRSHRTDRHRLLAQ